MNIFLLDLDLNKNVEYYIDKHSNKMVVETGQLLCTARNLVGDGKGIYRTTHPNHPCNVWLRQSEDNYRWLCELGIKIAEEYTFRYGKRHKSQDVIEDCYRNVPRIGGSFTLPPSCMDESFIIGDDVVNNYRNYYIRDKVFDNRERIMAKWTKRNRPSWFIDIYGVL